jgi:glycosyltransferase involved in cell wall biosynthesis
MHMQRSIRLTVIDTGPLVTLVIPTHGRRELVEQTLDSVRAQTLTNFEAIVIDDHSPDDTALYLGQLAGRDSRFRVMTRQGPIGGANVARNQGLAAARGQFVVFLDSDDLLESDCLQLRAAFLQQHPELDFSVHAMRLFHHQPNDTDLTWNTLTDEDDFERYLRLDGPWQTAAAIWRRTALERVGPWDPQLLSLQDMDYHIRALAAGLKYEKIDAWDCHYRMPLNRKSITSANRTRDHFRSHVKIADRLLALPDRVLDRSPNRRNLLVGFCFYIAQRCVQKGDLISALSLWNRVRQRGIAPGPGLLEGTAILLGEKCPWIFAPMKQRIMSSWPETWRMNFRTTLFRAPLPPRAGVELEKFRLPAVRQKRSLAA